MKIFQELHDEPDFIIQDPRDLQGLGLFFFYLGNIRPDRPPYFILERQHFRYGNRITWDSYFQFYESGQELDTIPEFVMSRDYEHRLKSPVGRKNRPADINGDGIHDLIFGLRENEQCYLNVCFGGAEFDTIPDLVFTPDSIESIYRLFSGYDVNGDGYDDIMIEGIQRGENRWPFIRIFIYAGGEELNSDPLINVPSTYFTPREIISRSSALLPDINGDGYDDWGFYWEQTSPDRDGFMIFFGSENPDAEPDRLLPGHQRLWCDKGDLIGGDFNGDGFGDVVTCMSAFNPEMAEICIYFGSGWFENEPAIRISPQEVYGWDYFILGETLGAVGDYNGDGVDDFCATTKRSQIDGVKVAILAGTRNWRVNAPIESYPRGYELSAEVYPNPFNDRVNLNYSLSQSTFVSLIVYDIQGRLIRDIPERIVQAGEHSISIADLQSGIYFAVL